ncbi:serine hydrolase [Silanimonas sp.]|uniref:serine hydrolase n=1 Tax=Silanimonas sp. TaxID=1929290 RepID=UPI0022C30168|nr:serine hydrolase [Silanimonas sp.]MCZ8165721.1 serine hydrolase [Silanimonas sp.]
MRRRRLVALAAGLLATAAIGAPAEVGLDRPALDRAVDAVRAHYGVPGLAVGIVRDGEVVYTRTVGEAVAGSGLAVDDGTIFKIASNSKAFTTALLGRLVDRGVLGWQDPVVAHRPNFRMADPWVTREMQVRDLLIHNSGLRPFAGDLMLWPEPNAFTRADIEAALGHLPLVSSFRSQYAYDNVLYLVAGEVAASVGGASYETVLQRELFEPLGLNRCRAGAWSRLDDRNVAQPHQRLEGVVRVVRPDPARIEAATANAAGGLRCSLGDLLRWSSFWLDGGDARLSPAQRAAIWTPHIALPLSERQRRWDNAHFHAYGYGWRLSDMDGQLKVAHTGTLAGAMSMIVLLPESDAGVVLLMNLDDEGARQVLMQVLVKAITDPEAGVDAMAWVADWDATVAATPGDANPPRQDSLSGRRPATAEDLGDVIGRYRSPWFGEVSLCPRGTGVGFASARSPRVAGTLWRVGEGPEAPIHLVFDDASVGGDVRLAFDGALTLEPIDAADENGFEDLTLHREGDCGPAAASQPPPVSTAATPAEAGMIRMRALSPSLVHDIRYATRHNFTGRRVPGYRRGECLLLLPAAEALARVERRLRADGFGLVVHDCYRPVRAVQAFVAWAKSTDERTKPDYYPGLEKSALVPDYIAEHSGHSRGATVDVALLDCRASACTPVDMGTRFDFFGPEAHTGSPEAEPVREARRRLIDAMALEGFVNYPLEWWHFSWRAGPVPDAAYGFDVE